MHFGIFGTLYCNANKQLHSTIWINLTNIMLCIWSQTQKHIEWFHLYRKKMQTYLNYTVRIQNNGYLGHKYNKWAGAKQGVLRCWDYFCHYFGDGEGDDRCVFHLRKLLELYTCVYFTSIKSWKTHIRCKVARIQRHCWIRW